MRFPRDCHPGTALSFVDEAEPQDVALLEAIQKTNPPRNGQPVPQRLPFDLAQVEAFSYR